MNYHDGLDAYEHGYRDCAKNQKEVLTVICVILVVVSLVGSWAATDEAARRGYRQGQIDAAEGRQHFFLVRKEVPASTLTEWHDDREETKR
jgi:hypothetical protein